jgi:hypothetical protein
MKIRALRTPLKQWIDERTQALMNEKIKDPHVARTETRSRRGPLYLCDHAAHAGQLRSSTMEKSDVSDGRRAEITNSAFGTAFGVVEGKPLPVCDHAGYAPFGFGYRRCPGEQLNIEVFGDFLRKVWAEKIEFELLDVARPAKVPIGPVTVIDDAIGFRRRL